MLLVFTVETTCFSVGFVFLSAKGEAARLVLKSCLGEEVDSSRNKSDPSVYGSVVCGTVSGEVLVLREQSGMQFAVPRLAAALFSPP